MKIAVTGASGHIGSAVCTELISRGYSVRALVRDDMRALEGMDVETLRGCVTEQKDVEKLVDGCDAVVHAAGIISVTGSMNGMVRRINVEGTRIMLRAARDASVKKFIHLSSIHAYEQRPSHDLMDEQRALVGERAIPYDLTKKEGHLLALEAHARGMDVVIINPTSAIGPPDNKPSLLGKAMIDMYRGRIPAVFPGGFDFADVRDNASGIANAILKGRSGEAYILGGTWYSMKQFTDVLEKVSGRKLRIREIPVWTAKAGVPFVKIASLVTGRAPAYTRESIDILVHSNRKISSQKAINELGYNCRPLDVTLADTLDWFSKKGYI